MSKRLLVVKSIDNLQLIQILWQTWHIVTGYRTAGIKAAGSLDRLFLPSAGSSSYYLSSFIKGNKIFELTNHLQNVLVIIFDRNLRYLLMRLRLIITRLMLWRWMIIIREVWICLGDNTVLRLATGMDLTEKKKTKGRSCTVWLWF